MMQAAYEVNGRLVGSEAFYEVACDPRRSVVVEACAGAGKTWMLVSRIMRALLDGVPPQQILAITFTKKAAGEMRERLHGWLRAFAHADDQQCAKELSIRGVAEHEVPSLIPRLRQLYAAWLDEGRGVDIHTIHGWFSRLVKAAPLDVLHELGLPPELNLVEDTAELWPELWGRFLKRIDAMGHGGQRADADIAQVEPPYEAFIALVREVGRFNAEAWLKTALANRLEVSLADQAGHLAQGVETVAQWSPQWAGLAHPTQALLQSSVRQHFFALAAQLATAKGSTARDAGVAIERALSLPDAGEQSKALFSALLTKDGEPRKRMGESEDLAWAQGWLVELQQAIAQHDAHVMHGHMVALSRLLFDEYAKFKSDRGLADMVDLELAAARLLSDPVMSGWIQQRLDSRVRQLLMDEFQDTSPLQWQTLKAWLSSYAGAGGGGQQPVQVFLVGDPKQSIYRFRRADPRVFEAAKGFVIDALAGDLLACDHTRRNAPGVIGLLNEVMGQAAGEGLFPGFRPHTTDSSAPSGIRVLPSVLRAEMVKPQKRETWRDTLVEPRERARTTLKEMEAAQVAQAVVALVLEEGFAPSEIQVLSRKRATLALIAEALDQHGVPHVAPENTLLIDVPEVRDLVAVLDVLVSPRHDLSLAHALKSPMLGAGDADLLYLAERVRHAPDHTSWWQALMRLGDDECLAMEAPPALRRAASLLARWSDLATRLPPHDLLERIVTEGECRERLAASVPTGRRAQALFHVDALLSQSLEMDSGRDATPYRWVRALKRLPLNLPPRAQPDAVQLLTIHGAKGLEARVVFIADADPEPARKDGYAVLVEWPEGRHRPVRCAFIRSQGKPPPSLARALKDERAADEREELNALYVALTRAREQLVFSRTEPRGQPAGTWWQRLVSSGAIDPARVWEPAPHRPPDEDPEAVTHRPAGKRGHGLPAEVADERRPGHRAEMWLKAIPALKPRAELPAPRLPTASSTEQKLGQTVHRMLEWLTALPPAQRTDACIERVALAAAREVELDADKVREAIDLACRIMRAPALAAWLDPTRLGWAGNEVALEHEGQTLRIDRLVALDTPQGRQWWVIDYKLAHRPEALAAYREQLRQYVEAVSRLQHPEPVRAAFVTGAGEWVPL